MIFIGSLNAQNNYTFNYDAAGNRTELVSTIPCEEFCDCPDPITSEWLQLDLIKNTDQCGPNKCLIRPVIDIPIDKDCYDHYTYDDGTGESDPIYSTDVINDLTWCVNRGEDFTLTILLYKTDTDLDPCILSKTESCEISCCESINVNFTPIPGTCCFTPNITTTDGSNCPLTFASVECYLGDATVPITPDQNGNICVPNANNTKIRYMVYYDNFPCEERFTYLTCESCDCPDRTETNGWLGIHLDKYDPACPPDHCKVTPIIDIPPTYNGCYDFYSMSYKLRDKAGNVVSSLDFTSRNMFGPNNEITGLPGCIPAGHKIQVSLRLYKDDITSDYCQVYSTEEYCQNVTLDLEPEPCMIDYPFEEWTEGGTVKVDIDGCVYWVTYRARKTDDGTQDIQLTNIESDDNSCDLPDDEIFKNSLVNAIDDLINQPVSNYLPNQDNDPCYDFWRVMQNTCWSEWTCFDGVNYFTTLVPCESDCCAKRLRVCRTTNGIEITPLNNIIQGSNDCESIIPPTYLPGVVQSVLPCDSKNCTMYNDWDDIGLIDDPDIRVDDFNYDPGNYKKSFGNNNNGFFRFRIIERANNIIIEIAESDYKNLRVEVVDINGKVLIDQDEVEVMNQVTLDSEKLENGIYMVRITSDNILLGNEKIIILR